MSEMTRAQLVREIAELRKRFEEQDRLLSRLKRSAKKQQSTKSPTRTGHPRGSSRRTASGRDLMPSESPELDSFRAWFENHLPAIVSARGGFVALDAEGRVVSAGAADANLKTLLNRWIGSHWNEHLTVQSRESWQIALDRLGSQSGGPEDRLHLKVRMGRAPMDVAIVAARRFATGESASSRLWLVLEVDARADELRDAAAAYWAGAFAHELNQPLAAVLTTAQACRSLLESGRPPMQEIKRGADAMVQRVQYAADVVRRLRSLAGGEPPRRLSADLRMIVRQAVEAVQNLIDEHRVVVHFDFPSKPLTVSVDAVQIAQVVANLARNAVEAMSSVPVSQRQLTVRIQQKSRREFHRENSRESSPALAPAAAATQEAAPEAVVVSIADRGAGLSVDVVHRLFTPLASTKPAGMGLGLALSRQIVEAHGGRIWAEGNSPHGCVFSFSLSSISEEP